MWPPRARWCSAGGWRAARPWPSSPSRSPWRYFLTKDGGRTFTAHEWDRPPLETQQASPLRTCRGMTGATGTGCDNLTLVRAGLSPESLPPGWSGTSARRGADGRIWLTSSHTEATDMMVSDDGGQTWKQLSWPAYGTALHLSPDGREPWVVSRHRMYQLVGDGWILRHTLSTRDDAQRLALLGDGLWFGRLEAGLGYLKDGVFTAESRLPAGSEAGVLADGTIVVPTDGGAFLGVGTGTDRQWIRVAT